MSTSTAIQPSVSAGLPLPHVAVTIREAVEADVPFIDSLQKVHRKQVGFMPEGQILGKIKVRDIIIAQDASGERVGYCVGQDRYFKHDDVGIIYQLNVVPGKQRGLIGAALLKAQFEKSAYGCKLYCCWCAQDIAANKFWEAMGFVPLAFRAGSEKRIKGGRVHIFWQKRIRAGDDVTPWWFPSKTDAGAMREDRLVLPIPPGTHWSAEMPRIVPEATAPTPALPRGTGRGSKAKATKWMDKPGQPGPRQFGAPPTAQEIAEAVVEKPKREKKPKRKADPKHVAASRELRDRYLEQVNSPGGERLIAGGGKYDVSRSLPSGVAEREGFFVGGEIKQIAA